MNNPIEDLELVSVSEIINEYADKPNFRRRRSSQEEMLRQAGIKSRMSMRSGRGYAHFITRRNAPKFRAFLNKFIEAPQAKTPEKAATATKPGRFDELDVKVELTVLRTEIGVQTELIKRLLRALGESDVLHVLGGMHP